MANPQKENGYTPIANELLEKIYASKFNATQLKIIFCVCRYTYGFSRKSHSLSLTFLSKATGISKRYISSELESLIQDNVINVECKYTSTEARQISLNKRYDEWSGRTLQQVNNTSTVEQENTTTVEEQFTTTVEESFHQDKQILKQNIKQEYRAFFESVWKLYPEKKGKGKISEAKMRKLYLVGYDTLEKCIRRYKNDKPDWKQWQNGSTFFNSGYVDYLDENYQQGEPQEEMQDTGGTF